MPVVVAVGSRQAENFSAWFVGVTLVLEAVDIKMPTAHLPPSCPFPLHLLFDRFGLFSIYSPIFASW
jgi:hypothetical protein